MYIYVYDMNKSSYFCRYLIFKLISLRKKCITILKVYLLLESKHHSRLLTSDFLDVTVPFAVKLNNINHIKKIQTNSEYL